MTTALDVNLALSVARAPYDTGRAGVPWEAVSPLTQTMLVNLSAAYLREALPVLHAAGWVPPETVAGIRDVISETALTASHKSHCESMQDTNGTHEPYNQWAGKYAYSEGVEHGQDALAIRIKTLLKGHQ